MVKIIGHKTGRSPVEVWVEIERGIATPLRTHDKIVRRIASELMCKGSIEARRLQTLLKPINHDGRPA